MAKEFLHRYGVQHGKARLTFAPDALRALSLHRWPGNVRELQNRVQRAVIMAEGKRVTARDLELTDTLSALPPQTLKEARESVEREMVQDALRRHRGKITSAALELGISRPTLYELMEKLGIARGVIAGQPQLLPNFRPNMPKAKSDRSREAQPLSRRPNARRADCLVLYFLAIHPDKL